MAPEPVAMTTAAARAYAFFMVVSVRRDRAWGGGNLPQLCAAARAMTPRAIVSQSGTTRTVFRLEGVPSGVPCQCSPPLARQGHLPHQDKCMTKCLTPSSGCVQLVHASISSWRRTATMLLVKPATFFPATSFRPSAVSACRNTAGAWHTAPIGLSFAANASRSRRLSASSARSHRSSLAPARRRAGERCRRECLAGQTQDRNRTLVRPASLG